jgi:hypothetical protein
MTKLLPCPFCGGPADFENTTPESSIAFWSVGCQSVESDCIAYQLLATFNRKCEAAEAWNRRQPQWMPIETAPRDGTPFLCIHPDDVFSPQTGIDIIWYEPSIKTYTMDGETEVPFAGITHWMPLPSPPQPGQTRGGS